MKANRSSSQRVHLILLAAILLTTFLVFVIPGCHDGSSAPQTGTPTQSGTPAQTGTLAVALTDAPACGFDAVNVTVSKVRIHQSTNATDADANWAEIILDPARQINLLDLTNGAMEELGETPLAAGHYSQLRLVLAGNNGANLSNSVIPSGTTIPLALDTPSAEASGLKLINEFDVNADERVDLLIDFDACKSVVTRGNGTYGLKPVMRVIPFTLNGIEGFVAPELLSANVAVSAQSGGTVVRSTVPNAQGKFFIARIEPGSYDIVITADNHATAVVAGVPVTTATSTVAISTRFDPITLASSGNHRIGGTITLNPANTAAAAFATALQSFPLGPTVTVKSQAVATTYDLILPTAAPLLGQFGTGILPITLNAVSAVAGQYSIEAHAPGYQTQSFSQDIATADATQNFILTP